MNIAKCHDLHKIGPFSRCPRNMPKIVAGSSGCKATGSLEDMLLVKDWVCFDTSVDHFWTLNSFVMAKYWCTTLAEGRLLPTLAPRHGPIVEQCAFLRKYLNFV